MKQKIGFLFAFCAAVAAHAQAPNMDLVHKFNESGSHYIQATFLNQVWVRNSGLLSGSTVATDPQSQQFDIGLRRTRMQLFGQLNDHVFVYFQFGQNNFNSQYNTTSNRKVAAFLHDAVCEYKVTSTNALKLGGGLTIANGLSRFSQPSIGTIMTTDVPVFAQATVDQTDLFSRKLSVYARGQVGKIDYRFSLSDPFQVSGNGTTPPAITENATFSLRKHNLQQQAYVMYQFFDHEGHTTPYMTGTYLGKKKVFNVAAGFIHQKQATWRQETVNNRKDTAYDDMNLWCVESFLDIPLNAEKGTAFNAFAGFYSTNYGKNYIRYNGLMNPASGTSLTNLPKDAGSMYGNALAMFGTGTVMYAQMGYLLPKNWTPDNGQLMPYVSVTSAKYDRLNKQVQNTIHAGVNWLIQGHKAKISLDYENRPGTILTTTGVENSTTRKHTLLLQYQIFW